MLALALRRVRGSNNVRICSHKVPPRYPQCPLHPPVHATARMLGTGGHARHTLSPCRAVTIQIPSTFRSAGRCGSSSTTLRHCSSRAHQSPSDGTHTPLGQEGRSTSTAPALHAHEHPSSDDDAHTNDSGSEVSVICCTR